MTIPNASDAQAASEAATTANNDVIVANHLANIAFLINEQTLLGKTSVLYKILEPIPRATIVAQLQSQGYTVFSQPQPYYPIPYPDVPGQNPFLYPFPAFYQYPVLRWDVIYINWGTT